MKEKNSFGIACCRQTEHGTEILMICKRFTYAYNAFIHGAYDSANDNSLLALFNKMTLDEKLDIKSLRFSQIWYRVWANNVPSKSTYFMAKNKFENAFVGEGTQRLFRLLNHSKNSKRVWEIPKGHRSKMEMPIGCAMREFEEETGILPAKYKLTQQTVVQSYIDCGVRYKNTYFIAHATGLLKPKMLINIHSNEVDEIQWVGVHLAKILCPKQMDHITKIIKSAKASIARIQ